MLGSMTLTRLFGHYFLQNFFTRFHKQSFPFAEEDRFLVNRLDSSFRLCLALRLLIFNSESYLRTPLLKLP